ncbi:MAG: hypothetical protein A4S09_04710 [Proteobacteria bacterium SG_bin7]|nr:MAG: hypothetical protein A4S09_04710 [Proteobacteria bacterium SG_bin7]
MKIILSILVVTLLQISCTRPYHDQPEITRYGNKSANLMSPQARLRKLSLHLRGFPPRLEEYDLLAASLSRGQGQQFYKSKIDEYQNSPQHFGKMMDRLDELFGVSAHFLPAEKFINDLPDKVTTTSQGMNSMDLLFRRIIKENLDWNSLYLGKEYQFVYPAIFFPQISDIGFYNAIRPDLPPSDDGVVRKKSGQYGDEKFERNVMSLSFATNDDRVAGAITTSRFFSRYTTTLLNKNRKRAAAIFRILLCDDMKPIIPANEDISDLVEKSFPKTDSKTTTTIKTDEIKHGTQQSCMACHQKLDPMGETFRLSGTVMSPEAAPGALFYPTNDGRAVHVPVTGIGHLTTAITQQHEYKQCQVRRFWEWFIGKDVPLSHQRLETLVREFENGGRRPKEFISYLVQQSEFLEDQSGTFAHDTTFMQIKPIMKQCTNCHAGITTKSIPNLAQLPFGGTMDRHQEWIKKIIRALDLNGNGSAATMPPRDSGWKLSEEERNDLRYWIAKGAQDDGGNKTIEVSLFSAKAVTHNEPNQKKTGTFGYAGVRYLSSNDIFRWLSQKFPMAYLVVDEYNKSKGSKNTEPEVVKCSYPTDQRALGYISPATQEPAFKGPSLAFAKWLAKCILTFTKTEFEEMRKVNQPFDKFLGKKVLEKTAGGPLEEMRKAPETFSWSKIPQDLQTEIATHLVQESIGRNVAAREDQIVKIALIAADNLKSPMVTEAIQRILLATILQDEFLTY